MKIVSGGQTGVDRAALDVAIAAGLPYGGWVPKGGLAEDYPKAPGLLSKYPALRETETSDPAERTGLNVRDSDATLILLTEPGDIRSAGTRLTQETARELRRPLLIVRADKPRAADLIQDWLLDLGGAKQLNVAGPRENEAPGIYALAVQTLDAALRSHGA